jgi:hypothetical protein
MSFIEISHSNPGAVTKKLQYLHSTFESGIIQQKIEQKLDEIYQQMYKVTPVKTGYLRSTIKVSSGGGERDVWAQITVTARYAYYVDRGISPMGRRRAQPFWSNSMVGASIEMIVVLRQLFAGTF